MSEKEYLKNKMYELPKIDSRYDYPQCKIQIQFLLGITDKNGKRVKESRGLKNSKKMELSQIYEKFQEEFRKQGQSSIGETKVNKVDKNMKKK